jgi:hypothetical protein
VLRSARSGSSVKRRRKNLSQCPARTAVIPKPLRPAGGGPAGRVATAQNSYRFLRHHDQPLSPPQQRLNRRTCYPRLRFVRPRHPREEIGVDEYHSPSIRV